MGKITVETCDIEGLKVITPTVFGDARGYFVETYNYNDFKEAGIDCVFVQDNQSASKKGVLRGLHFQINFPQDKLVRVDLFPAVGHFIELLCNGSQFHGIPVIPDQERSGQDAEDGQHLSSGRYRLSECGQSRPGSKAETG